MRVFGRWLRAPRLTRSHQRDPEQDRREHLIDANDSQHERGTAIGSSSVTQVTIGLQLGGQTYSEVIFFKDKAALDKFKGGDYEVAAGASAVALKDGVSKAAEYNNGVAIFTMGTGGLMFEASVGGQKFSFEPR